MRQSKKEQKNWFRCRICQQIKVRGNYVRVKKGEHEGYEVKTCSSDKCLRLASQGKLA